MTICPSCGSENPAGAKFCNECGARLLEQPTVLEEPERTRGASGSSYYPRCLPDLVRTALSGGTPALAERLLDNLTSRFPVAEHAVCAGRAALAEHSGDDRRAASLYAEAAERWREFGNVPERAYALLGHGRRAGAAEPLREARELFAAMGYAPALAETEALLARAESVV